MCPKCEEEVAALRSEIEELQNKYDEQYQSFQEWKKNYFKGLQAERELLKTKDREIEELQKKFISEFNRSKALEQTIERIRAINKSNLELLAKFQGEEGK